MGFSRCRPFYDLFSPRLKPQRVYMELKNVTNYHRFFGFVNS